MNTQKVKQQLWLCMIFLISFGLLLSSLSSNAMVISWDLQWEYSGAFPPEGPPPWLTAIIDDEIVPEPSTIFFLFFGLIGFVGFKKKIRD